MGFHNRLNKLLLHSVTISHRPTLQAYHDQMLAIGDGKQGFRLSSVDRKSALDKVEAVVASSLLDSSTEKSIRNHQEARSAVYKDVPPPRKIEPGSFWTQLRRLMKISLGPGYRARFATSTACIIAQILLRDMDEGLTGQMYVANMTTDRALAWVLIRKTMGLSVLLAGLDQVLQYTQRRFNAEIQDELTKNLSARYLREDVFYQLKMVDGRIQDPTHRIADDVRDFAMFFTQAWPEFLSPLCHIVFFVFRLAGLSGSKETAGIIGYFGLATLALRLLMPDYKSLVYKTSSLEGKYKFVHSRVKAASESIAFFGGDDREHKIVASRFDNVMALDWHKQILDFKFEFCQHVFQGFMPGIFQFILRFNYMVRAGGGDAEYLATKGAATYEGQWRIMTSNSILFDMLGRLMKFSDKRKMAMLSRFVALSVSLTLKPSPFQSRRLAATSLGSPSSTRCCRSWRALRTIGWPRMAKGASAPTSPGSRARSRWRTWTSSRRRACWGATSRASKGSAARLRPTRV